MSEGSTKETVVSITDDDVPDVEVSFGAATYSVAESDDTSTTETMENEVTVKVKLDADPRAHGNDPADRHGPGRRVERRLLGSAGERRVQQRGH